MKKLIPVLLILASCKGGDSAKTGTADKYEATKMTLEEMERKDPVRFLSVSGRDKRNLLGQTVINGTVVSKAKAVSFKDIDIQLSFYSKTGVLLEQDHEMLYEKIKPGDEASFKTKYFAPKGTDSIAMKVVEAKAAD